MPSQQLDLFGGRDVQHVDRSLRLVREREQLSLTHACEDATKQLRNKSPEELAALEIIFERGGKQSTFPLWNMINGPISDIMYHSGQIVSFRRTNGNPLPKGVNVFTGRTKE